MKDKNHLSDALGSGYMQGFDDGYTTALNKASQWLKDNLNEYIIERKYHFPFHIENVFDKDELIKDFRIAIG